MQPTQKWSRLLCCLPALLLVASCSGNGDDPPVKDAKVQIEAFSCDEMRPETIKKCEAPPNGFSTTYYSCECKGNQCDVAIRTAACDLQHGDCRYFASSCIPLTYQSCSTNDYRLGGLCGRCFIKEDGSGERDEPLAECDTLSKINAMDGGT